MVDGRWRRASWVLLVPAAVAGLAACSSGGGHPAGATASPSAGKALSGVFSAAELRGALLTRVNGVAAATPASSGAYATLSAASTAAPGQVTPKACSGAATQGFNPAAFGGATAAAVTFKVAGNGVSEMLITSTGKSAATALAGSVPAGCAKYAEKVDGKTVSYGLTETAVSGIGQQAKVVNLHSATAADDRWSLIYRGHDFIGTVTVTGPNASEAAVRELGQQAYAFAAKSLS
jgi:hypothetical protein